MGWVLAGECNHCGACCLREGGFLVENACISLDEDRCRFYTENENPQSLGHCLIMGRGRNPIEAVLDQQGVLITARQIQWFLANCPSFPQSCVEAIGEGRIKLPSTCSFQVKRDG